nr:hypothetical protein [Mycoplasmopsis bovis]
MLLLLHRIPEGFLIGFIISGIENKGITSTSVAFLISLILHLIPEQVLFYYRQREIGWSRAKALFISTLCLATIFACYAFRWLFRKIYLQYMTIKGIGSIVHCWNIYIY